NAEVEITIYEPTFWKKTDKIENMTFTLEREKSTYYILKFGEKSPIQCSLKVENVYYDKNGQGEESGIMNVQGSPDQSCKVTDKDGNIKTAHVKSRIIGTLYDDKNFERNYIEI